ncbi:MAG: glycosyltransferase [Comamonadaceae bacterium]|nr:glycosyltransferase [Comamonadaceae bacterium]
MIAERSGVPVQSLLIEMSSPYLGKAGGCSAPRTALALPNPHRTPLRRARRRTGLCRRARSLFPRRIGRVGPGRQSACGLRTHRARALRHPSGRSFPATTRAPRCYDTVRAARAQWAPVWVVVDGSTDGTAEGLQALAATDPGLRVRGAAAQPRQGRRRARKASAWQPTQGFTHALTMDSDGQHPADLIADFMARLAARKPEAMVLGVPVFDADAPRAAGAAAARCPNWWANLETLWRGHRRLALRLSRLSDRPADPT